MELQGLYERSFLGRTLTVSTTGSSQRKQLVTDPNASGKKRFLLYATEDVHLRQGDDSVAASGSDFYLASGTIAMITVTAKRNSYLAVVREDTNGTLYVTDISSDDPGNGASGSGANPFDD